MNHLAPSTQKASLKCHEAHKDFLEKASCLLTISVGQELHEGEKLQVTAALVNATFKSCIIMIDDTLQRYTLAFETNQAAESLRSHTIDEGNAWLERNKAVYESFDIPMRIVRWDWCLQQPTFREYREKIITRLARDLNYQETFRLTAERFLLRYKARVPSPQTFNWDRAYKLSISYLIEECTALCTWKSLNCNFELYPSKRNWAMAATHELFIRSEHENLLNAAWIKFKNKPQSRPQSFPNAFLEPSLKVA